MEMEKEAGLEQKMRVVLAVKEDMGVSPRNAPKPLKQMRIMSSGQPA